MNFLLLHFIIVYRIFSFVFFIRNITQYKIFFVKFHFIVKINLVQFFWIKKKKKDTHRITFNTYWTYFPQFNSDMQNILLYFFLFTKNNIIPVLCIFHICNFIHEEYLFYSAKTNIELLTPRITAEFFRIKYSPRRIF